MIANGIELDWKTGAVGKEGRVVVVVAVEGNGRWRVEVDEGIEVSGGWR